LAHKARELGLFFVACNKCNCARQRMVALCQKIPGCYLAIFGFSYFLFLPRPLTSELVRYDYSKSQLFIFRHFYAGKV
jgi:hypothetical protein